MSHQVRATSVALDGGPAPAPRSVALSRHDHVRRLLDSDPDDEVANEEIERVARVARSTAALRRYNQTEAVRLARGGTPSTPSAKLAVQLTPDGPAMPAPPTDLLDLAQLDAWVKANVPDCKTLDAMALRERSTAIRSALLAVGVACSKRPAGAPVLLLSAYAGRNQTEQLLAMQRHAVPALANSPLEVQIALTRETRTRFAGRLA